MKPVLWALALSACTAPIDEASVERTSTSTCVETRLAYGNGELEVGLIAAAQPSDPQLDAGLARGPQAVAVRGAETLVLDSVHGRILAIGRAGTRVAATGIARDAEQLAVGPDGAIAVYSPLQAKAWVFEPSGALIGEVAIDRSFRNVVGIAIDGSRRVVLHTAFQETYVAGSVHAPVALSTSLTGKREGAFAVSESRTVIATAANGAAQLKVLEAPVGTRGRVAASYALPGRVDAAMLAGATGTIACLRVEQVDQPGEAISVKRRAVCIDTLDGHVVLDQPMAQPGLYLPRQELAVSSGQLATITAAPDALVVRTCPFREEMVSR